jgi:CheY-like chemotaxis protein
MNSTNWRVMIVEDEADSRAMVKELLEYYGITCLCMATAEDALQQLEDEHPTLIVTDLALPGMDGFALLRELQRRTDLNRVPRVAITAYHTVELAERAIEEGFDAYFAKPLDAASFVDDLRRIIEG